MNVRVFVTVEVEREFEYENVNSLEEAEALAVGEIGDEFQDQDDNSFAVISVDSFQEDEDETTEN